MTICTDLDSALALSGWQCMYSDILVFMVKLFFLHVQMDLSIKKAVSAFRRGHFK